MTDAGNRWPSVERVRLLHHLILADRPANVTTPFLNNNYHLVHHDLPHVPWFALRNVYETSRQQYVERSGGFLVKGYSEWFRRYGLTAVAHPVADVSSDRFRGKPPASIGFAGRLQVKFMVAVRDGARHEAHLSAPVKRETKSQAL